jgi:two-component system chemotaxis response regulator CheY
MKVLVVDDSMVMRKIILNALVDIGIGEDTIVQCGDGSQAIAAVAKESFDLILMDWNMPNVPGIEAVKSIRSSGNKTPIIMVTTEGEKDRVITAIQAGANNYLVKPFDAKDLKQKVKATLGIG